MSAVREPVAVPPPAPTHPLRVINGLPSPRRHGGLMALIERLQSSLEPPKVLRIMHETLGDHPQYQGLEFETGDWCFALGDAAFFSHDYALQLDGVNIGRVRLNFDTTLDASERAAIEQRLSVLAPALRNALAHQRLQRQVHEDALTGLLNRHALATTLPREIARAQREGRPLSVVLIDLDHFKAVNDSHGHEAGDRVLVEVGAIITATVRESDLAFRFGGEEFMLLLPDTDEAGGLRAAQRLRVAVADRHGSTLSPSVTLSAGIATLRAGDSPDHLLGRADRALYRAKGAGRNRCTEDLTPAAS